MSAPKYCAPCRSHFCPHARPDMYANDAKALEKWEAWIAEGRPRKRAARAAP